MYTRSMLSGFYLTRLSIPLSRALTISSRVCASGWPAISKLGQPSVVQLSRRVGFPHWPVSPGAARHLPRPGLSLMSFGYRTFDQPWSACHGCDLVACSHGKVGCENGPESAVSCTMCDAYFSGYHTPPSLDTDTTSPVPAYANASTCTWLAAMNNMSSRNAGLGSTTTRPARRLTTI